MAASKLTLRRQTSRCTDVTELLRTHELHLPQSSFRHRSHVLQRSLKRCVRVPGVAVRGPRESAPARFLAVPRRKAEGGGPTAVLLHARACVRVRGSSERCEAASLMIGTVASKLHSLRKCGIAVSRADES